MFSLLCEFSYIFLEVSVAHKFASVCVRILWLDHSYKVSFFI